MDREPEELQFIGYIGIYREAFKIICSWRKILSQVTLALILPLSFIYLAQIQVSEFLFSKILQSEDDLDRFRFGSATYNRINSSLTSELVAFWLFKAAYVLILLVFSLLATSATIYAIACIYTSKEITFKKVMSVVPKVWKRLTVTFLWNFVILFVYNFLAALVIIPFVLLVRQSVVLVVFLSILIVFYLIGFVYISTVWHLASVVSVLEDVYGIKAMTKSRALIKGKLWVACAIFVKFQISFSVVLLVFVKMVVRTDGEFSSLQVVYGFLCFILLSLLILLGLVIQTVVYFVCKSYHHENIDKSCLADHLEVYLGDYVPLKSKDVQLESLYV